MRMPRPWPRTRGQTTTWYVTVQGKQITLGHGTDPVSRRKVQERYVQIMADQGRAPKVGRSGSRIAAVEVMARFLSFAEDQVNSSDLSQDTFQNYHRYCSEFARTITLTLAAQDLRPYHVTEWMANRSRKLGDSGRFTAIAAVKRAFSWAAQQGLIESSPIGSVQKPTVPKREVVISQEQASLMLDQCRGGVRDAAFLMIETGLRPKEIRILRANHVSIESRTINIPWAEHKTGRRTRRARRVHLTEPAVAVLSRLITQNHEGPLIRNTQGRPFTKDLLARSVRRAAKRAGIPETVTPYVARHTFATRSLISGNDSITVAEQLGHTKPTMVAERYQHVGQNDRHMKRAADRASTRQAAEPPPSTPD